MTKNEIRSFADAMLDLHGLFDWQFAFNNRKTSIGLCSYRKKTIFFSLAFIDMPSADIQDTVLHEIAHALVGGGNAHNEIWRAKALEIGCRAEATGKTKKTPSRVARGAKWFCIMPNGDIVHSWFRRPAKNTFATMPERYVKGRKAETQGKLSIISRDDYCKKFPNKEV